MWHHVNSVIIAALKTYFNWCFGLEDKDRSYLLLYQINTHSYFQYNYSTTIDDYRFTMYSTLIIIDDYRFTMYSTLIIISSSRLIKNWPSPTTSRPPSN